MEHETMTAGQLAEQFSQISRPAVSRHLRVLRETGLVKETKEGREVHYRLNEEPLQEVDQWLQRFWNRKLLLLKRFVEMDLDTDEH